MNPGPPVYPQLTCFRGWVLRLFEFIAFSYAPGSLRLAAEGEFYVPST